MSAGATRGRGGFGKLAGVVLVLAGAALVLLTTRASPAPPYSSRSTAPDGYRALVMLAEAHGAEVRTAGPAALAAPDFDSSDVIVVTLPSRLDDESSAALDAIAGQGATVVLGHPLDTGSDGWFAGAAAPGSILATTPAAPAAPGRCRVEDLRGLGPIDTAFASPTSIGPSDRSCYGDEFDAYVLERDVGPGRIVTLADPTLWANARLQPDKENGGQPLANAAMALALIRPAEGVDVLVIESTAEPPTVVSGSRDPIDLLPVAVKLALAQGVVALVLYLWWRGRRLGAPVAEPLPVDIPASELVLAVGDLLRRRGSAARAASTMRADVRRVLTSRLGIPPGSPPEQLIHTVAERTGRPVEAVRALLWDPVPARDEDLVRLATDLDSIRQEVLDDQPVR